MYMVCDTIGVTQGSISNTIHVSRDSVVTCVGNYGQFHEVRNNDTMAIYPYNACMSMNIQGVRK